MIEWLARWSRRRLYKKHERTSHPWKPIPSLGRIRQTPLYLACQCGAWMPLFTHVEITWPEITLREDPRLTLERRLADKS